MKQKYEIVTESGEIIEQFRLKATAYNKLSKIQGEQHEKCRIRRIMKK